MSFAPLSLQATYALISALDPSLNLPSDDAEKDNAIRIARETGKWDSLVKVGEQPTTFWMRQLKGTDRTWLIGHQSRNRLTDLELCEIAFRLAIDKIDNFGSFHTVKRSKVEGRDLATNEVLDAIYAVNADPSIGQTIVAELGGVVIQRLMEGVAPKS